MARHSNPERIFEAQRAGVRARFDRRAQNALAPVERSQIETG
jgi:hypothetical protein